MVIKVLKAYFMHANWRLKKKEEVWYVDSKCSNHMTGHESIFCKLDMTATTQIIMSNGVVVKSKGKGTIAVV